MPTNSILTIHNQTVMVHPIVDRYYNGSPAHDARSTAFVQTKGLTANEKVPIPPVLLDATTPGTVPDGNPRRLVLSPVLGTAMAAARSRTPDLSSGLVPTLPPPPPPLPISQSHGHQQSLAFRSRSPVSQLQQTHGSIGPEVPAAKVAAGPAASSSVSHQTPSLTSPPTRPTDAVAAGQRQPSQGNIKKKRRSLQSLEQLQAVAAAQRAAAAANGVLGDDSDTPLTPLTPDDHDDHLHGHHHSHIQSSTSHGNPNKIARYFPELTLG